MEKLVMKADEAAEVLNVGKSTVYDLCDRGILPRIKKLPGLRFRAQDVYALAGKDLSEYSPYQCRNLKSELAQTKAQLARIKAAAMTLVAEIAKEDADGC